jgi:predicted RNase H-like nuclease (RuvC/YqgF family)
MVNPHEFDLFNEGNEELTFLEDEHQLKKDISKLNRTISKLKVDHKRELKAAAKDLKATTELYEDELERQRALEDLHLEYQAKEYEKTISALRDQLREMLEKNWELKESSNLFLKGLEQLKKEGIRVTQTISWSRKGVHGSLEARIAQISMDGKRIINITPMRVNPQGETVEALIIAEYFDRNKKPL